MKSGALRRAAAGAVPSVPSVSAGVAIGRPESSRLEPSDSNLTKVQGERVAYDQTGIARVLGVNPRTISRDIERYRDFPAPLRVGLGKRLYVLAEVIEFYRRPEVGK